jgi:hypothetical protein
VINYKSILLAILVGLVAVYGARRYTLGWATMSMDFGCREAAQKEYMYFSVEDGNRLSKFCDARQKAVTEEFKW